MVVLGLLGGIASGKSLVADQFSALGAEVLRGDEAGHAVLRQPEVVRQLAERWGQGILDETGAVQRPAVAAIVFAPHAERELAFLEGVTHPRIGQLLQEQLAAATARNIPMAVLDAALLLKAGWDRHCDAIVFVDAPVAVRRERALARGWKAEDFEAREAAQGSLAERRARCRFVLDNSESPEATLRQVESIWREMTEPAGT